MGLAARLQGRIDELDLSHAQLAERVGVATQTIWKLATGNSQNSRFLHKIARELGTTPEYLLGETSDPSLPGGQRSPSVGANDDPDDVQIDSIDLAYGMGGTFLDTEDVQVEKATFSRAWLRKFTPSPPELLASTEGVGDSMWPTIHDRDTVIVDRAQRRIDQGDKIWAVVFGGVGMIKRLRPLPDGSVKIMSDNPQVSDEIAFDSDLYLVGRVAAIVRRV